MPTKEFLEIVFGKNSEVEKLKEKAHLLKNGNKEGKAGELYKKIGNLLLKEKMFSHALFYYSQAVGSFSKDENYQKSINCMLRINEIHELQANVNAQASTLSKIASFYEYHIDDQIKAGRV